MTSHRGNRGRSSKVQNTIYWKTLKPGKLHLGICQAQGWRGRHMDHADLSRHRNHRNGQPLPETEPRRRGRLASVDCLSFIQAQQKAFELHVCTREAEEGRSEDRSPHGGDLAADYLAHLKAQGQADDRRRAPDTDAHPARLGKMKVEDLTTHRLIKWRDAMAAEPARLRTAKGKPQQFRAAPILRRESAPAAPPSTEPSRF